ncbi:MAG: NUDIX hydrolase [Lactobacillus sp.]|jgi:8-oxo-dGTP pyrophosphatase MutT (NUDIX family)|nr:NUDIX hydrolase [Lactobacillus sp.]
MNDDAKYPKGVEVIGSTYILNDKNQILMTRHYRWEGIWLITGGHVEPGESIEQAVIREAKEELNLDVEVLSFIGVGEFLLSRLCLRGRLILFF